MLGAWLRSSLSVRAMTRKFVIVSVITVLFHWPHTDLNRLALNVIPGLRLRPKRPGIFHR